MTTKPSYTPTLRFPDFLNDGEWEVKRLGEIITVNSGRDYKHLQSGDIPVYGTGGYMLSVNDKLSDIDAIGIGRKGTIDKPQYLKAPFWTVDTLFFLTTKEGYDLIFVFCLLQTVEWKKYSEQTGVPSLTRSTIEKIEVKIPPFSEQRRIAQALTALDELIAATNEKLEQLKAYKKGLMQKLFPAKGKKLPELRFKEFEKDGEWEEKKLGEITTDIYQPQTIPQSQFSADGYPVYGANGIIGYYEFYNHDTDQILVTCRGSSCGTINYSVGKCWITGNAMVINLDRVLCHYDKRFVYYMLLGMDLSKLVTGSGQPQIVRSPLLNLEVSVTNNINEQRRIVDCLGSIDKMINQYTNKVAFLELYKKGLMQQMFPTSK